MDLKKFGVGLVVAVGVVVVLPVVAFVYFGLYDTPDFTKMRDSVEVPIRLANGDDSTKWIGPKAAGWVGRSGIADFLARAVVASEDTAFFSHSGIDVHEIQEALKKDLRDGKFSRGASTLTQQVLKNVFLGNDKNLWRKFRELVLAPRMEKVLSKTEILTFYLNMAEWGPGIYGCGEAARYYFGVPPSQLTPKQSVFLAMLLPSPRRYHAYFKTRQLTQWANNRLERILQIMHKMNQLDDDQFQVAMGEQLWGRPALPDDAPGAPQDPGAVADGEEDFRAQEIGKVLFKNSTPHEIKSPDLKAMPQAPGTEPLNAGEDLSVVPTDPAADSH